MADKRIRDLAASSILLNSALEVTTGDAPGSTRKIPAALVEAGTSSHLLSRSTASPPMGPEEGDRYLLPENSTGAWAGRDGEVACWLMLPQPTGASVGSWYFAPASGVNYVEDEKVTISVDSDGTQTVLTTENAFLPSIAALRAATNLDGATFVIVAGYYGIGTFGGGAFVNDQTAGADNGGTVIHSADGKIWRRISATGSVAEWGAFGDVVTVTTPATGTVGQNTFTTTAVIPTSAIGKPIAIVGAGVAGATLTAHITGLSANVGITTVTIDATIGTSFPTYVATDVRSIDNPGTNQLYAYGDAYLMSDGTTVIVNFVTAGNVVNVTPSVQSAPLPAIPSGSITQVSATNSGGGGNSGGLGLGMTLTLKYVGTGQFSYGTDDSAAINAALSNAHLTGINPWLPLNWDCGVAASSINIPFGTYLEGQDQQTNRLVALGSGLQRILYHPNGVGGGARYLTVDAMKLAPSAVEIVGTFQIYDHVRAQNGTVQEWFGSGLTGGCVLNYCDGRQNSSMFGQASVLSQYNYNLVNPGSIRLQGVTADGCSQASVYAQAAGLYALTCDVFGGSCWALEPLYGFDVRGSQASIVANQVGSVKTAAYRLAGAGITCVGNVAQWGGASYPDPATTYGILLEGIGSPYFAGPNVVTGNTIDKQITPANGVFQNGTSNAGNIVNSNVNATYVYPALGSNSGAPWAQPTTNSYASAALAAGGTPMGQTLFNQYDTLFKSIGPALLARMDGFYILATIDEPTALTNAAKPGGPRAVKHGVVSFTQFRGYAGDGVTGSYIDTQVLLNGLPNWALNSASMLVWTGSPSVSLDANYSIGCSLANRSRVNPRQLAGTMSTRSQAVATDTVASSADSIGSFGWTRYGSATAPGYTQYVDAVAVAHPTTAATSALDGFVYLLADGTVSTTRPLAIAMFGGNFSDAEVSVIDMACKAFLTAVGAPT